MNLSFFPLSLEAVDQAAVESLCLFVASDERPLTGLAGLVDWRLSARLSRLLRAGLLSGDAGEAVLTPPGARMGFQKLFLFGVGRSDQSEESLVAHLGEALRKLAQAGVREAALELPSRLAPAVGLRTLVNELQGPGRAVVFASDPQRLVAALAQVASGQTLEEKKVTKVATPAARPGLPRNPPLTLPKASPLPFAPQGDLPLAQITQVPPPAYPAASATLPFANLPEPIAPAVEAKPPEGKPEPERKSDPALRPTPPPPQRYVPSAPKQNVFQKGKKKQR
jgi:hypothetical protein